MTLFKLLTSMKVPLKKLEPINRIMNFNPRGRPRAIEYMTVAAMGMKS